MRFVLVVPRLCTAAQRILSRLRGSPGGLKKPLFSRGKILAELSLRMETANIIPRPRSEIGSDPRHHPENEAILKLRPSSSLVLEAGGIVLLTSQPNIEIAPTICLVATPELPFANFQSAGFPSPVLKMVFFQRVQASSPILKFLRNEVGQTNDWVAVRFFLLWTCNPRIGKPTSGFTNHLRNDQ